MASIPVRGLVFFLQGELGMMVGERETRCVYIYICTYIIDIYIFIHTNTLYRLMSII